MQNKQACKTVITYVSIFPTYKCFFCKYYPQNTPHFQTFEKAGIYVIVVLVCYQHAKCDLGISIFDKVVAKNC